MDDHLQTDRKAEHVASFLTFRMARTQNKLNAQITYFLRAQSDLSLVDWRVLYLLDSMGDTTMSQMARMLHMDKGQLCRKIRGLVDRALILSWTDANDSRQQLLRIDAAGQALVEAILPVVQRRQRLLLEGISEDDLSTFFDVLSKIDAASENRGSV